jgi:hypothetical protein
MYTEGRIQGEGAMIFTRRFGALAARPQFPDAPELDTLNTPADLDAELAELTGTTARETSAENHDSDRRNADESAA